MKILKQIQKAIMENDSKTDTQHSMNYQKAIDQLLDLEDLEDLENSQDQSVISSSDPEEASEIPVSKKDMDGVELTKGSRVEQYIAKTIQGTVLAVGELIEVQWDTGRRSFEYPEELYVLQNDDSPELDKIDSNTLS